MGGYAAIDISACSAAPAIMRSSGGVDRRQDRRVAFSHVQGGSGDRILHSLFTYRSRNQSNCSTSRLPDSDEDKQLSSLYFCLAARCKRSPVSIVLYRDPEGSTVSMLQATRVTSCRHPMPPAKSKKNTPIAERRARSRSTGSRGGCTQDDNTYTREHEKEEEKERNQTRWSRTGEMEAYDRMIEGREAVRAAKAGQASDGAALAIHFNFGRRPPLQQPTDTDQQRLARPPLS